MISSQEFHLKKGCKFHGVVCVNRKRLVVRVSEFSSQIGKPIRVECSDYLRIFARVGTCVNTQYTPSRHRLYFYTHDITE